MRGARAGAVLAPVVLLLGTACSSGSGSSAVPSPDAPATTGSASAPASAETSAAAAAGPGGLPRAEEVPAPEQGACYDLSYAAALAPTSGARSTDCERRHTAVTFGTGRLRTAVDGHLLAVDSDRVQEQPARRCGRRFGTFVGGSEEDRRLSMLRAVWFTPTVAQSDRGAEWFRCDVIAVRADQELARLGTGLRGVLATERGADRYGMCGTAAPDDRAFERVVCARQHSWRAVSLVDLPDGAYPGRAAAREAGQGPCEDAGRDAAADPAEFEWGYEWPDPEQWAAGQTYGRCWAPD